MNEDEKMRCRKNFENAINSYILFVRKNWREVFSEENDSVLPESEEGEDE